MVAHLRQRRSRLARLSWWLALLALVVLVAAAVAHRFGAIGTPLLYGTMAVGFSAALFAVLSAGGGIVGIWRDGRSGLGSAIRGLLLGLLLLAIPSGAALRILSLPQIADVTTDLIDPPTFRLARSSQGHYPARPSDSALSEQEEAYPDVFTHRYVVGPQKVFDRARRLVQDRGWPVLDQVAPGSVEEGRIEAVAATAIFAFRSDVVIRVAAEGEGTRVDLRAASRWGLHDMGANADFIRAFLADLDAVLAGVGPDQPAAGR